MLQLEPTVPVAVLVSQNGVQNEIKMWTAPVGRGRQIPTRIGPCCSTATTASPRDARGDDLFLLSHKDAPTFKVLQLKAGAPLSDAR